MCAPGGWSPPPAQSERKCAAAIAQAFLTDKNYWGF